MVRRYKVTVTDFIADDLRPETQILGDLANVVALDSYDENEVVGRIEDSDAIMLYHNIALTRKTIDHLTRCKLIVRCGVGYDNVDFKLARQRGISVANIPDYGTEEVADSAIGMMLALTRGIAQVGSLLRAGVEPWSYTHLVPRYRLRGRVFGVVGLGRIGTAVTLRAKAMGMDVAFYDPYKPSGYDKVLGVRRLEHFDELLAQSYVLSLHCPLTEETFHLIDDGDNCQATDRGIPDQHRPRHAWSIRRHFPRHWLPGNWPGRASTFFEHEPPAAHHPLLTAWRDPQHPAHHRLILNPHSAFYSEEGLMHMRPLARCLLSCVAWSTDS